MWNDPYCFTPDGTRITRAAARVYDSLPEGEREAYVAGLPSEQELDALRNTVGLVGSQKFSRSERRA